MEDIFFVKKFFDYFPELEGITDKVFNKMLESNSLIDVEQAKYLINEIPNFLYGHLMEINPRQRLEVFVNIFANENGRKISDKIAANMIVYDFWTSSDIGKSDWKTENRILDLLKLADKNKNEWYQKTYDELPTKVIIYR